jgi:hypothetical protein
VAIGKISLTEAEQGWAYTLLQAAEAPGLPPEEAFDLVEYSLGLTGEAQRQIAEALRDPARMTAARLQRRPITKQHHYALERQGKHGVRLETQRWLLVALGAEVLAPALRPFTPPTDIPPDLVRQEDGEPNDTPEPAADLADEMAVGDVGITPGRRVQ